MTRVEKNIIALMGLSHALTHSYLLIFPATLLLLQKEFSLSYFELGVISNIMTFTYGLGALPGGMIFNRLGAKKLYLLCFLGSTGAAFLTAMASNVILFTAGLALLGALGSVYHPMGNALITSKVREYSGALGIHGAAGNIGVALAPVIAGLVASQLGWRKAYIWFMIPGILLSIWAAFVDMKVAPAENEPAPLLSPLAPGISKRGFAVFFTLPLVLVYLINTAHSFNFHGAITFLPAYMAKHTSFHFFSWDSVAIGGMLSGLALFMGVFGQYMGGVLGQKPNLERNTLVIAILVFPFILAMSLVQDLMLLLMALAFFFLNFGLQPMTNVLLAQYTTVDMRGTAFGIFFFAAFGIGSLAGSFAGYIAQHFGLPWVFLGLSCTTVVLIFLCYLLLRIKRSTVHRPQSTV